MTLFVLSTLIISYGCSNFNAFNRHDVIRFVYENTDFVSTPFNFLSTPTKIQ